MNYENNTKKEIKQIWRYVMPNLKFKDEDSSRRTQSVSRKTSATYVSQPPLSQSGSHFCHNQEYSNVNTQHRTRSFNNNHDFSSRSPSISIQDANKVSFAKIRNEVAKGSDLANSISRYEKSRKLLRVVAYIAAFSSALVIVGIALAMGLIIGLSKSTVKDYNESCSTGSDCKQASLLICQNGICICSSSMYYSGSYCVTLGTFNSTCTNSGQCSSALSLVCSNNKCQCSTKTYWSGSSCVPKASYTEPCSAQVPCQDYNFLTCNGSVCICPLTHVWDPVQQTCLFITKKSYTKVCLASSECNETAGLICPTTSGTCNCPVKSYTTFCDCRPGYFYDFSVKKCRELLVYGESCCGSYQCKQSFNLTCTNGICDCPISPKMYWVPAYNSCRILPKNCKEVKAADPTAQSGIFYLASSVGLLEAYCEMVIDGGGYTFVPWLSLSASTGMLQDIYKDKTKVLFRLISRSNSQTQPYILTKQLSAYSSIPIGIQENSYSGYTLPINVAAGSYVFIGMLPASKANITGATQGMLANGVAITFLNCDGLPNSYFALFANQNPTNPSGYTVGSGMLNTWKAQAQAHPLGTYMPSSYYYFAEMHQGGCGGYAQSDRWSDYFGVAFGMI